MFRTRKKPFLARYAPLLLFIYCSAVLLFFLAELKVFGLDEHLRATNQVLILFALLILPFVVISMPTFIQSLTLKVSDKEFHVQLSELEETITGNLGKVEQQVSSAEQSLWPLLAGEDYKSDVRLSEAIKKIIIGSKQDPSHIFFTELLAQAIELWVPDTVCEIRYPNGGSLKNFAEVKFRWIDIYIDFTGTCSQYFNIDHKDESGRSKPNQEIINELNRYGERIGMKWLNPLGCSEDYCLSMEPQTAKKLKITSIKELRRVAHKLVFTADPEFINRKDCYLGLQEYGIKFKEVIPCHVTARYAALEADEASVFVSYESDPQVINEQVVKLSDPDGFFPRYMALPLVSQMTLDKVDGLEDALGRLANRMTTEDLNAIVVGLSNANFHPLYAKGEVERLLQKIMD